MPEYSGSLIIQASTLHYLIVQYKSSITYKINIYIIIFYAVHHLLIMYPQRLAVHI